MDTEIGKCEMWELDQMLDTKNIFLVLNYEKNIKQGMNASNECIFYYFGEISLDFFL